MRERHIKHVSLVMDGESFRPLITRFVREEWERHQQKAKAAMWKLHITDMAMDNRQRFGYGAFWLEKGAGYEETGS